MSDIDQPTETQSEFEIEELELEQGWAEPAPDLWDCGDFYEPSSSMTIIEDLAVLGVDALSTDAELLTEADELEQHHLNRLSPLDFVGFLPRSAYRWLASVKHLRPVVCGCGTELATRDVPHIANHTAWTELMQSHGSGCPWVNSRGLVAPSTDVNHDALAEIVSTLTDTDNLGEWQCAALVAHDWLSENVVGYDKTEVIREE